MSHRFGVRSGNALRRNLKTTGKQVVRVSQTTDGTAYTVTHDDYIISADTSGGTAQTITIPTACLEDGRILIINDWGANAATKNITVATEGDETIDGAGTATISANNGSLGLYSDGSNWFTF